MSYALAVTDGAVASLHNLIDSLPAANRRDAIEAVDAATQRLAANPGLGQSLYLGRRAYHFGFRVGDTGYHWGCAFLLTEDESEIQITHIFRVAL